MTADDVAVLARVLDPVAWQDEDPERPDLVGEIVARIQRRKTSQKMARRALDAGYRKAGDEETE